MGLAEWMDLGDSAGRGGGESDASRTYVDSLRRRSVRRTFSAARSFKAAKMLMKYRSSQSRHRTG
jgi:hypothetical protein